MSLDSPMPCRSKYSLIRLSLVFLFFALSWAPASDLQAQDARPAGTTDTLGEAVPRVLMVGDSWAEFMWIGQSLRETFAANGRPDILEEGSTTALSGTTAGEWTGSAMLQLIDDALAANPTIDTVQLTMGGNDFLAGQPGGGWWTGMSAEDEALLRDAIATDVAIVTSHILAIDPELEIVVSLYDYTNFDESLTGALGFSCSPRWDDLGQPTALEINTAAAALRDEIASFIGGQSRITMVDHTGLMQFVFGFPGEGIPPGQLLPPGDANRHSPIEAMWLGADCIHLGVDGYLAVAQNLWDNYYDQRFNGTLYRDGFESGNTAAWGDAVP